MSWWCWCCIHNFEGPGVRKVLKIIHRKYYRANWTKESEKMGGYKRSL
jgi:hypothetical protein